MLALDLRGLPFQHSPHRCTLWEGRARLEPPLRNHLPMEASSHRVTDSVPEAGSHLGQWHNSKHIVLCQVVQVELCPRGTNEAWHEACPQAEAISLSEMTANHSFQTVLSAHHPSHPVRSATFPNWIGFLRRTPTSLEERV